MLPALKSVRKGIENYLKPALTQGFVAIQLTLVCSREIVGG